MSSNTARFDLLIGGQLVKGDRESAVINPATEKAAGICARASAAQLDAAVAAARAAFPEWRARSYAERAEALLRAAEIIAAHSEEIGALLTAEQGKPIAAAIQEAQFLALAFRFFAGQQLSEQLLEDSAARRVVLHRRALGVVAAIVPWNFPLSLLGFKVPPALITGNSVVVKPAATTPLATLKVAALIKDVFPAGVLNVIADDDDLGPLITAHPDIAKISFTGSTATGRKVMESASPTLKRITLELGGNDAAIVLPDVDVKAVAAKLFQQAFRNSGQVCIAAKRIYAHEAIYEALCAELAALAEAAIVGDGMDPATQIGPLQNRRQFERVTALIEDARASGRIISGGDRPDRPGYFIRPTIVRDIEDGAPLVDEEQFGPVLPVIRFSDPLDAVRRANASEYGLGGSIWSDDVEKAETLAQLIDSGTVWVNNHAELLPNVPFGGAKMSGLGVELGTMGLEEFTQVQVVNVTRTSTTPPT